MALTLSLSDPIEKMNTLKFDAVVVGGGLAGFTAALDLAENNKVALISKSSLQMSASNWAQGGVAAVLDPEDSFEQHIRDTLVAGAGLCDEPAVRHIVERGPEAIQWLINMGVPFTQDETSGSGYHLTREGGHSQRRVIHSADATGQAIQTTLEEKVRTHPNISLFENHFAIDLITSCKLGIDSNTRRCYGLYVLDEQTRTVITFATHNTVLATGGAGKVYLYTTNPDISTGDGVAMAWRAGCRVANMEFIQFHPTCLYHPYAKSSLISEAVRGEGGLLKLPPEAGGTRFMPEHDERAELAPRDVVARAIDFEMKKRGLDFVHLDISHKGKTFLSEHFPNIQASCQKFGIDMTQEPIPVVPAAHYTCGGIVTDLDGQTDIVGLYAIGEVAYTGMHGANRLASNSLLECLVMGQAVAHNIKQQEKMAVPPLPDWDESRVSDAYEEVVISHNWDELRRFMWNYVGIVRTSQRLQRAEKRIQLLEGEVDEYYANYRITSDLLELRNLVAVASLIVRSGKARQESRGLHFSRDYPQTLAKALPTILIPEQRLPSIHPATDPS